MKLKNKIWIPLLAVTIIGGVFSVYAETDSKNSQQQEHAEKLYHCSMHPQIVSDKPGTCPICGMNLVEFEPANASSESNLSGRAQIHIQPERQQLIGMKKETARRIPFVVKVRALGRVAYNPDIYNALGEYRDAFYEWKKNRGNSNSQVRENSETILKLAEMKLRIAGFSNDQMKQITDTSLGTKNLINNASVTRALVLPENAVWINVDIYEPDSDLMAIGQKAIVTTNALPGQIFEGVIRTVDPVLNEMPRLLRVRIEIPDSASKLKAAMAADVMIEVPLGEKIVVPHDAVLDSGERQMVFVEKELGFFEPREIKTGYETDDLFEVNQGLAEGETVVSSAVFLVDSESRLSAAVESYKKTGDAKAPSTHSENAPAAGGHPHG